MAASAVEQLRPGSAPEARRGDPSPPRSRRYRWRAATAAVIAGACLALSACGSSGGSTSTTGGTGKAGGSLTVLELGGYAGAWPAGLDPATNTNGAADQDQMNSIYGQLFELTDGA